VSFTLNALSQQDGYQTHFQFNEMSYNPSYAGKVKEKMCVSMLIHQQYAGFKSDLIKKENSGMQDLLPYNIGASTQFLNISARLFKRIGVAVNIINDKIGPQTYILPKLSLSYYQVFNDNSEFSVGLYYGQMQKSLDGSKLRALSTLQNGTIDPSVPMSLITSKLQSDLGAGLHYFSQSRNNLNVGVSAAHLLESKLTNKNATNGVAFSSITRHYYGNASMDFDIGQSGNWVLQPNVLVKYGAKMQVDLNALAYFQQTYYGGLSFRQGDNINLMVGYVQGDFKVGYAFDFVVNGLKPGSRTTHEVFVQYCKSISTKEKTYRYILNPRHMKDSNY